MLAITEWSFTDQVRGQVEGYKNECFKKKFDNIAI